MQCISERRRRFLGVHKFATIALPCSAARIRISRSPPKHFAELSYRPCLIYSGEIIVTPYLTASSDASTAHLMMMGGQRTSLLMGLMGPLSAEIFACWLTSTWLQCFFRTTTHPSRFSTSKQRITIAYVIRYDRHRAL